MRKLFNISNFSGAKDFKKVLIIIIYYLCNYSQAPMIQSIHTRYILASFAPFLFTFRTTFTAAEFILPVKTFKLFPLAPAHPKNCGQGGRRLFHISSGYRRILDYQEKRGRGYSSIEQEEQDRRGLCIGLSIFFIKISYLNPRG